MSQSINDLISSFCSQVVDLSPSVERFALEKYRDEWSWPDWASSPGVYFFEQNGVVQYVGRALRTTLRARLSNQCGALGEAKWDAVINDPRVAVGVVHLPQDRWYLAAALEAYLITALRPPFSRRIS